MNCPPAVLEDIAIAKESLSRLPTDWDGKKCILELKAANYNWKQMEWWAFYFEHLCHLRLGMLFEMPGEQFGTVRFDAKRSINWDFKAKAIKSDAHLAILNDTAAMDASIQAHGAHGLILALCDVEYNDDKRTFQKWHERLKGGKSPYTLAREKRTSVSRYRKTRASLTEILFLVVAKENIPRLDIHHQGRNSNGKPRPPKYMLDLERSENLMIDRIVFAPPTK